MIFGLFKTKEVSLPKEEVSFTCSRCGIKGQAGDNFVVYQTSKGRLILCREHYEEFDTLRRIADEEVKLKYYDLCASYSKGKK